MSIPTHGSRKYFPLFCLIFVIGVFFSFAIVSSAYPFIFVNKGKTGRKTFEVVQTYTHSTQNDSGWINVHGLKHREFSSSTFIDASTAITNSVSSTDDNSEIESADLVVSSSVNTALTSLHTDAAYPSIFFQVTDKKIFDYYETVYKAHNIPYSAIVDSVSGTLEYAKTIESLNFVTSSFVVSSSTIATESSVDPMAAEIVITTPSADATGSIPFFDSTSTEEIPTTTKISTSTSPDGGSASGVQSVMDHATTSPDSTQSSATPTPDLADPVALPVLPVTSTDDSSSTAQPPNTSSTPESDDSDDKEAMNEEGTIVVPFETTSTLWIATSTLFVTSTAMVTEDPLNSGPATQYVSSSLYAASFEIGGFLPDGTKDESSRYPLKQTDVIVTFAHTTDADDIVLVEYFYLGEWQPLGVIDLSAKVAPGKLKIDTARFTIPVFENIADVLSAKLKVSYLTVDPMEQKLFYIDRISVEVIHTIPEEERVLVESSSAITVDAEKTTFKQGDHISFTFYYDKHSNTSTESEGDSILVKLGKKLHLIEDSSLDFVEAYVVDIFGSKVMDATPYIRFLEGDKSVFAVDLPKHFDLQPSGEYHLIIRAVKGKDTYTYQQDFAKGVLALNSDQEEYVVGSTAFIQMASLDSGGHTLCESILKLIIIKPDNTADIPEIIRSGHCSGDTVVSVPDYFSYTKLDQIGTYTATLEDTANDYKISIPFSVVEAQDIAIKRQGPTRIYPPAPYPMKITVKPNVDFKGFLIEEIPSDFVVISIAGSFKGSEVRRGYDRKAILWAVDMKAGVSYELSYVFDAPNISPYMFYLGPLSIGGSISKEVHRWQIASDAIETRTAWLSSTQTTNSTNLNSDAAYALSWSTSTVDGVYFTHSTGSNPERLAVKIAGDYLLSLTVPMQSSDAHTAVETLVKINGSAYQGGVSRSSYISASGGQNESSNHAALLLENLSANDYVEVYTKRIGAAGTILIKDSASIYLEYIPDTGKNVVAAVATTTVNSSNFNTASQYGLKWSSSRVDAGFSHNNSASSQNITLQNASLYYVSVNVPIEGDAANQSVGVHIMLDGNEVSGGGARQGYISNQSGHNSASVHWSGFVYTTSTNRSLSIEVGQDAASGTVTVLSGQKASMFVQKLQTTSIFASRGSTINATPSTDWNPGATSSVKWTDRVQTDTSLFTHSTSSNAHQITIASAGNYVLSYTDSISASTAYVSPIVQVYKNDQPVAGTIGSTHYIRNSGSHTKSSVGFFVYLYDVQVNDVLTVKVVEEGASGAAAIETQAELLLWEKPNIQPSDAPSVSSVTLNSSQAVSLVEGSTKTVTAQATVTDPNGYADLENVTARIFRSGVTSTYNCTLNDNNCYAALCTLSSCSGNNCTASCSIEMQYHADPTDTGTPWASEYWLARVTATDKALNSNSSTSSPDLVDVQSMLGFSAGAQLQFGETNYSQSPGTMNASLQLQSYGNSSMDFQIYGTDLTYTTSSNTYTIPASSVRFATSSGITYSSGITLTTSSAPLTLYTPLRKVTDQNTAVTTTAWFGLYPPAGLPRALYSGTITILGFLKSLPWP